MKRIALALTLIIALFVLIMAGVQVVEVVKANLVVPIPPDLPIFYIRSDGTIDPTSAPLSQSGDTYFLMNDIVDYTIKIQKDNIIFDGNGHLIQASPVEPPMMIPVGWRPAINLDQTNNITIRNVKLKGCYSAIYVDDSKNITIINNDMVGNVYGVVMRHSFDTIIIENQMINGSTGIIFYSSSNNTIVKNNISSNIEGIDFYSASTYNNCIKTNNLTANTGHAIFFNGGVVNHTIIQNIIAYNRIGIGNDLPYWNCTIYSNNFIENSENLQIMGVKAAWDKGGVGNYWSNYNGTDANSDGIGDTPYIIDANNIDHYPLMKPVAAAELPDGASNNGTDKTEPFPTTLVIASAIAVATVGLGLLFYFKKRRAKSGG